MAADNRKSNSGVTQLREAEEEREEHERSTENIRKQQAAETRDSLKWLRIKKNNIRMHNGLLFHANVSSSG